MIFNDGFLIIPLHISTMVLMLIVQIYKRMKTAKYKGLRHIDLRSDTAGDTSSELFDFSSAVCHIKIINFFRCGFERIVRQMSVNSCSGCDLLMT